MVQKLFDNNVFIYTMAGLCILGVIIKLIVDIIYKCLMKASDNMGNSKNKLMKLMKLKFEACYKLKIGVNNVDAFVDKYVYKYKFCGIFLYTWENISGQLLILCMLTGTVSAVLGLAYDCGRKEILLTFFTGVLTSGLLIIFETFINLQAKRKVIQVNIREYLDNFLKVRLERECFHPELLEEYRKEYFVSDENQEQDSEINNKESKKKKLKKEEKVSKEKQRIEQFKEEMKKDKEKKRENLTNMNTKEDEVKLGIIKTEKIDSVKSESVKSEIVKDDLLKQIVKESDTKSLNSTEEIENLINNLIAVALNKEAEKKSLEDINNALTEDISIKTEKKSDRRVEDVRNTKKEVKTKSNEFEPKRTTNNEKDSINKNNMKVNESIAATVEKEFTPNKFVSRKEDKDIVNKEEIQTVKTSKRTIQNRKRSKANEINKNEERIIEDILKEFLA